jgi:hypothetical protein
MWCYNLSIHWLTGGYLYYEIFVMALMSLWFVPSIAMNYRSSAAHIVYVTGMD